MVCFSFVATGIPSSGRGSEPLPSPGPRRAGSVERVLEELLGESVDRRFDLFGAVDQRVHQLDGRELAPHEQPLGLSGAQVVQLGHGPP
jgi:hypothetical protein